MSIYNELVLVQLRNTLDGAFHPGLFLPQECRLSPPLLRSPEQGLVMQMWLPCQSFNDSLLLRGFIVTLHPFEWVLLKMLVSHEWLSFSGRPYFNSLTTWVSWKLPCYLHPMSFCVGLPCTGDALPMCLWAAPMCNLHLHLDLDSGRISASILCDYFNLGISWISQ